MPREADPTRHARRTTPVAELRRLADACFALVAYYNLRPCDPTMPSAAKWLAAQRRRGVD
jgi:hypothetical protein